MLAVRLLERAYRRNAIGTLCGLLLFAMPSQALTDETKPLATIVIVARADLPDSNFRDATVLVMNNMGAAPVGIIINRPTRIAVSELFPENERLAATQDKVYFGGPVHITTVSFIFRAAAPAERAVEILDGVYFSASRELLDKLLSRDKPLDGLRIFIGYSGWAPGQLEAEIARGDWTATPAKADSIFGKKSERVWPERESPGASQRI